MERKEKNMAKRYYIAYGSNLNIPQMRMRCPSARIIGTGEVPDYRLLFRGSGTGAYLTIEPFEGGSVPVAAWEVSAEDERALDRYEGYPAYYIKKDVGITMTDLDGKNPKEVTAMVYVMTKGHGLRLPWRGYYEVLEEGYERFGFDKKILEQALAEAKEADR